MRSITHCPSCQTQFFVTEEQLNQHGGKVRCGQCLHVFDAKAEFVEIATNTADTNGSAKRKSKSTTVSEPEWPLIHDELLNDDAAPQPATETEQPEAIPDEIKPAADSISTADTEFPQNTSGSILDDKKTDVTASSKKVEYPDNKSETSFHQPSYFDDFVSKTKFRAKQSAKKSRGGLWTLATLLLLLLLTAGAQSIYFLRDDIAIYYPNAKPYLIEACQKLTCSINLPKQIEFIVIDDSDMQEDVEHAGLMHLASTLINKSALNQAYPNLELTLTDVEDKPVLRRIFKPAEYLPANTDIAEGFKAGEEIRIKLAMTTPGVAVSGYRVFVTY